MTATIRLAEIAHARSGDKGNHANIGVIAWTRAGFEYLGACLTAEQVAAYLAPLSPTGVDRFSLPGILAYNFVVRNVLDGGASRSLRSDSQGKLLAAALLEMPLPAPHNLSELRPSQP
jgi:hypothetical protein